LPLKVIQYQYTVFVEEIPLVLVRLDNNMNYTQVFSGYMYISPCYPHLLKYKINKLRKKSIKKNPYN